MMTAERFYHLENHRLAGLFDECEVVWQALDRLPDYLADHIEPNVAALRRRGDALTSTVALWKGEVVEEGLEIDLGDVKRGKLTVRRDGQVLEGATVLQAGAILSSDDIQLGKGSFVEAGALIKGPTIIGDRSEIRHGAYVRGTVLVGDECVVGHATEMKGSVMLGGSQAGHFAYLGDSILGRVNLGAGTKLANLKVFAETVKIDVYGERYDTGRRKVGAILADGVELGCNSVTTPGTVLGRDAVVYPNVTVRGFHPAGSIIKRTGREAENRDASR